MKKVILGILTAFLFASTLACGTFFLSGCAGKQETNQEISQEIPETEEIDSIDFAKDEYERPEASGNPDWANGITEVLPEDETPTESSASTYNVMFNKNTVSNSEANLLNDSWIYTYNISSVSSSYYYYSSLTSYSYMYFRDNSGLINYGVTTIAYGFTASSSITAFAFGYYNSSTGVSAYVTIVLGSSIVSGNYYYVCGSFKSTVIYDLGIYTSLTTTTNSELHAKTVTYGSTYGTLPTVSRTGYTFNGWYTAKSGGTKITSSSTVSISADQTLYAQWTVNTYNLYYDYNYTDSNHYWNSGVATKSYLTLNGQTGTYASTISTAYTTGYITNNAIALENTVALSGSSNYSLSCEFTITSSVKTIYFGMYNGTYTAQIYASVSSLGLQTNHIYRLSASYNATGYLWGISIYHGSNNGHGHEVKTVTYDSTYGTLSTPTRTGYTFGGWYTAASGGTQVTSSTSVTASDRVIYAHWTANTYTINIVRGDVGIYDITSPATSWNYNGGNVVGGGKTVTYEYGTTQTIAVSMFDGYNFSKWSDGSTSASRTITITGNATYTAYTTPCTYTLTYDVNGGNTLSSSTKTVTYKGTYGTLTTPTRSYYTFLGWYTAASGGTNVISTTEYNTLGDSTIYAHWTPTAVTVKVTLCKISKDGKTVTTENAEGGYVMITYYYADSSSATSTMKNGIDLKTATGSYSHHAGQIFIMLAYPNSNYKFVGYSTSSSPDSSIKNPTTSKATSRTKIISPTASTSYYVYFKEVSSIQLKYDSVYKYYYFENGEYPQSYAGSFSTVNTEATLTVSDDKLSYVNEDGKTVALSVYSNTNGRYLVVTAASNMTLSFIDSKKATEEPVSFVKGEQYCFKFEAIKWRVSDYGVEDLPENWATYTSYNTIFTAVSDLILGFGALNSTTDVEEGTLASSLEGFSLVQTSGSYCSFAFGSNTNGLTSSSTISVDKYNEATSGNAVSSTTVSYSSALRIASMDEINACGSAKDSGNNTVMSDKSAKASDLVAFMLGTNNNKASYWTRDLYNLGSGVAVTASGTTTNAKLTRMLGMRFAYTFKDGSMVGI